MLTVCPAASGPDDLAASVGATAVAITSSGCVGGDGGGSSRSANTRAAKAIPRRVLCHCVGLRTVGVRAVRAIEPKLVLDSIIINYRSHR
eukprot:SAG31_NODE_30674_length_377_cov_1.431655_2_plen_89_part_01